MTQRDVTTKGNYSYATQEIVNLTSNHTIAHEALLRDYQGLSITDFISTPSLFGKHSVALCQCIAEMQRELMMQDKLQVLFTNFSPDQISSKNFMMAMDMFYKNGITPSSLAIEVTEQGLPQNVNGFCDALNEVREHGHPIIVDDFGSGVSNFSQVVRVKPSIVKTDKTLIQDATTSIYARKCLHALINYIQDIGAKVVIEGIETEEHRDIAEELGANYGQGYFFGRPVVYKNALVDEVENPAEKPSINISKMLSVKPRVCSRVLP